MAPFLKKKKGIIIRGCAFFTTFEKPLESEHFRKITKIKISHQHLLRATVTFKLLLLIRQSYGPDDPDGANVKGKPSLLAPRIRI